VVNYEELLQYIYVQNAKHLAPDYIDPVPGFPLPRMYTGQGRAIAELRNYKSALICSHTGAGKTATFLTMTPGIPTLIIEPRKFLQKQCASYRDDTILFGRSEYPCHYASTAATAPCNRKIRCSRTEYAKECPTKHKGCEKTDCQLFAHDKQWMRYPCSQCEYIHAVQLAKGVISHGGTVICNFGNFWQFLKDATLVVVDEADLFFKEISSPKIMKSCRDPNVDIKRMLQDEIKLVDTEMQTCTAAQYYHHRNTLYQLDFLYSVADLCFTYKKKEKVYVEVNPANTNLLKDHIFKNKDVLIVTATPGEFQMPSVSYSIHQRCGIYYVPQGKLTVRSLQQQPFLLNNAAKFIHDMSGIFGALYDSKQFIVHCGNIGYHATNIKEMLNDLENKGKRPVDQVDYTVLHERGNLMGTIEKFVGSDRKYLLVASAEYGMDASWCNCQFVLKVPYASFDDRLRALERKMGKEKFKHFYTMDALNKLIQQAGRIGRGWDSFGATWILDSKFGELYGHYKQFFPDWFNERLCKEVF
jgi:hypothetical protein